MKWLKKTWQDNPEVILFGVSALLSGAASIILLKENAKLKMQLVNSAGDCLGHIVNSFNEGYELAMDGQNNPYMQADSVVGTWAKA